MSYLSIPPSDATISSCITAITVLYDTTSSTVDKQSANAWLTQLQNELVSWQISDQLLSLPYNSHHDHIPYFAANTLLNKIVHTYHQLGIGTTGHNVKLQLRDSLINHLIKYNNATTTGIILTRLALCVSTLSVYMISDNSWPTALGDMMRLMNQTGEHIDEKQQMMNSKLLLEIYTYIPEQSVNDRMQLSDNDRTIVQHILQEYMVTTLLAALNQFMHTVGNNAKLQQHVYNCFLSWIRDVDIHNQPIDLSTHVCYTSAVQAIQQSETEEVAADIISQVVRLTHVELSNESQAINTLLPTILQLLPLFNQARQDDNVVLCKKLSQIYVDLAETYIEYITYMPMQPNAAGILEALLVCVQHTDKDVSSHTFNFWYLLTENIDRTQVSKIKQEKIHAFQPYYTRVVNGVMNVMAYPIDYIEWTDEQREDSKRYRYFAADTLLDCTSVIGATECLIFIWAELQHQYTVFTSDNSQWHRLEACLYCIRCIARKIDDSENLIIPQLFNILPHISSNTHMRYTATLIVGRYADWINAHKQYLPQLLQFIIDGLNDAEIRSSASLALKHVCESSATYMGEHYIDQLYNIYKHSSTLPITEQKQIAEALCCVIAEFDKIQMQQYADALLQPHINVLTAASSGNIVMHDDRVITALDLVSEVYHFLDCSTHHDDDSVAQCIYNSIQAVWPLLLTIMQQSINDDKRIEKLCRVIKYGIKGSRIQYMNMIQTTVDTMLSAYNASPHSAFLYILSIVIDIYGVTQQMAQAGYVGHIVEQCSHKTLALLQSADMYAQHADIVEDYFELLSRVLTRVPDQLLRSYVLNDIILSSLHGLQLLHRESFAALMTFYSTLLMQAVGKSRFQSYKPARNIPPHTQQVMQHILTSYGQTIVNGVIHGIAGQLPPGRVQYVVPVLFALLDIDTQATRSLLKAALANYNNTDALTTSIVQAESQRVLRGVLEDWSKSVRRTNSTQGLPIT